MIVILLREFEKNQNIFYMNKYFSKQINDKYKSNSGISICLRRHFKLESKLLGFFFF